MPLCRKQGPVWPASAARAADWPRPAEAPGSLSHALALKEASGEPAGRKAEPPCFRRTQAPSGAPLYEVVACDAFTSETKLSHLARVMALPDEPHCSDLPPLLIVNFMIPNYAPSGMMATAKRTDGPGWNFVLYCRQP